MKKILSITVLILASTGGLQAQMMQASLGPGSAPTRINIYIKPDALANGNISTLQFDVAISSAIAPIPTLSIVGVPPIGSGWQIDPSYIEDGYRHYQILTGAVFNVNIGAGIEAKVMELQFTGGPVTSNNVALVTLPGGGSSGNALFYCSGVANSVENFLYYNKGGVTVVNALSYTGALPSSATISGILLPVKILSFDAVKQNNDAFITWTVENEENNSFYEVQRSLNGSDYTAIGTVNKSGAGNGTHNYNYTDLNIARNNSSILYYRLRQVETNSRATYSDIRSLRLNMSSEISVYPNPVKKGFYVSVPFNNPDNRIVKLELLSNSGQLVQSRDITAAQARNYYFDISTGRLASGQYQLQIIYDGKTLDNRKLLISQE